LIINENLQTDLKLQDKFDPGKIKADHSELNAFNLALALTSALSRCARPLRG
jgi:hypothetical protein